MSLKKALLILFLIIGDISLLNALTKEEICKRDFIKEYTRGCNTEKLLNICKEWLKSSPNNPIPNYFIWTYYATKGGREKVRNLMPLAFGTEKDRSNALKLISFFKNLRVHRINSDDIRYESTIGHIYNVIGDFQKAIKFYNLVLEKRPDYAGVHINIAGCYRDLGKYDEAIYHYKRALNITGGTPELYIQLAWLSACKGNYDDAEKLYKKVIKRWPDYEDAYVGILELYKQEKKYAEMVRLCREMINKKILSESYVPYYYIGIAYFEKNNLNLALKYFNLAHNQKIKLDDYLYYEYKGRCYLSKGNYDYAEKYLKKSVEAKPTASGYFYLGNVYEKKGNYNKAKEYYKIILNGNYSEEWKEYIRETINQIKNK